MQFNYALKIDYLMECILESHKLWNRLIVTAFTIQLFLYTGKLLNWMSDNLKIPIIWHLGIVPILEILLFTQKAPSLKQGHVQKILSVHQLLWYHLTSCLILCQLLQLWRLQKTQRTLNHMKEIPKCSTLLLIVQSKYRYNKNLGQCSYHLFMIVVTRNAIMQSISPQVSAYSKPSSGLISSRTIKAWCSIAVKVSIDSS
jgi:hypothetical protein